MLLSINKAIGYFLTHCSSGTMFLFGLKFCALFILCFVSVSECVNSDDRVVLVSPVLAPYKSPRARLTETAKDFPVLMLLATEENGGKMETHKVEGEPSPIYVQKLEDLKPSYTRRRRFSKLRVHKT